MIGEMAAKSHNVDTMVCGYHVYKEIRCAAVGEELSCIREVENYCDSFTVAVVRLGVIVGQVPRKISLVCSMASSLAIRTLRLFCFDHFTSVLADSIDNDGNVVDRGHMDQEAW